MKSTIITIGSEVLSGDVLNRNARNFSIELDSLGYRVKKHLSIDDDYGTIVKNIKEEVKDADLVLVTGGLGPTRDDMTKEAVSQAIERDLVLNKDSQNRLRTYFKDRPEAYEENLKQAYFPQGSKVLVNKHGTADGFLISIDETIIIVLPGPPRENLPMYEAYAKPYLLTLAKTGHISRFYRIYGIGEWETEFRIRDLIEGPDQVATFCRLEGLFIKVTLDSHEYEDPDLRFKDYEGVIREKFQNNFVSQGFQAPELLLGSYLIDRDLSFSAAESITGGMIASKMINVAGISSSIKESYITYSNEAKEKILGVSHETIDKYGVVSKETCQEMLLGLSRVSGSDLCLASTGFAGPGENAGLVYIGAYYRGKVHIEEKKYMGTRSDIRGRASNDAIINGYRLVKALV